MNLNQPYLFYDRRTGFDQHLVRLITRLSNNSALSKLLDLDVASISAVAFQCNNNPGERSVANLLPLCTKKAQDSFTNHYVLLVPFCG
jgi:hypothetical protein